MNSLQIDIILFATGYVIAFVMYLIDRNLGLKIKTALNYVVIAFVMYLMICSVY